MAGEPSRRPGVGCVVTVLDLGAVVAVPPSWPASLHPRELAALDLPTPFLVGDLRLVAQRLAAFEAALPGRPAVLRGEVQLRHRHVLRTVAALGSGFEVASIGELSMLQDARRRPRTRCCTATRSSRRPRRAARRGRPLALRFDSEGELDKIAQLAPGGRPSTSASGSTTRRSVFPLSRKFGAEAHDARALLLLARSWVCSPTGSLPRRLAVRRASAWRQAIAVDRTAHAPASPTDGVAWRCSTSAEASRHATASRSRRSSQIGDAVFRRWTSCCPTGRTAGRRAGPAPRRGERRHGRERPRP